MKRSIPYDTYHQKRLEDPEYAKAYLEASLEAYHEDGDREVFLHALRNIAAVQGDAPKLHFLDSALESLGYRLSVEPIEEPVVPSH
ncbi:MAG: hypothetical protein C4527_21490 [Candidatus Omnitrophota bacterium]|jgi:DNA-binding phage protein|nr:MAG: hypothetical protein C4527_21490 [Candidatus Omnitrophota bacterium]